MKSNLTRAQWIFPLLSLFEVDASKVTVDREESFRHDANDPFGTPF